MRAGRGTIRYIGNHKDKKQPRIGIEMDYPVGTNNGTVGGKKYFSCAPNYGILVVPTKATIIK